MHANSFVRTLLENGVDQIFEQLSIKIKQNRYIHFIYLHNCLDVIVTYFQTFNLKKLLIIHILYNKLQQKKIPNMPKNIVMHLYSMMKTALFRKHVIKKLLRF